MESLLASNDEKVNETQLQLMFSLIFTLFCGKINFLDLDKTAECLCAENRIDESRSWLFCWASTGRWGTSWHWVRWTTTESTTHDTFLIFRMECYSFIFLWTREQWGGAEWQFKTQSHHTQSTLWFPQVRGKMMKCLASLVLFQNQMFFSVGIKTVDHLCCISHLVIFLRTVYKTEKTILCFVSA